MPLEKTPLDIVKEVSSVSEAGVIRTLAALAAVPNDDGQWLKLVEASATIVAGWDAVEDEISEAEALWRQESAEAAEAVETSEDMISSTSRDFEQITTEIAESTPVLVKHDD